MSTANTDAECRRACLDNADCIAYDFNGGCYVHTDRANIVNINTNVNGVTHYQRRPNPDCQGTGSTRMTTGTGTVPDCVPTNAYAPVHRDTAHTDYPTVLSQTGSGQTVPVSKDLHTLCQR